MHLTKETKENKIKACQELAKSFNCSLEEAIQIGVKFREIERDYLIVTLKPYHEEFMTVNKTMILGNYSNHWCEIRSTPLYQNPGGQDHYDALLSVYLKACHEGIFPCEADGNFGLILRQADPEESISLYPESLISKIG